MVFRYPNLTPRSIMQFGGSLVIVGDGNLVLTLDGVNWTAHAIGITSDLYGIASGLVPARYNWRWGESNPRLAL
jgi:hypothetical protein